MGDGEKAPLRLQFNPKVRLEFHGSTITSDAGLLAFRELDDALDLTGIASNYLQESRTGRNILHHLVPLLRQSIYSRLAGYDDTNDAERTAGSENAEIRAALFDAVRQNPAVFKPTRNSLTDGWIILHEEPACILEPSDYGPAWDDGTPRRKIEAWIDNFAAEQFPEMNRIIVDCLRRHQES